MADIDLNELEARVSTLLQDNKGGLTVEEISKRLGVAQAHIHTVLRTLLGDGSVAVAKGVWKLAGETTR
jgi:predicted transcriptional regulator